MIDKIIYYGYLVPFVFVFCCKMLAGMFIKKMPDGQSPMRWFFSALLDSGFPVWNLFYAAYLVFLIARGFVQIFIAIIKDDDQAD